jgi:hypothetical protein
VSSVGWIENPLWLPYSADNGDIQIGRHAIAIDEVGVGSVGTFCAIALLISGGGAPYWCRSKRRSNRF